MKEDKLKNIISKIDTDPSMDQRILNQLLDCEEEPIIANTMAHKWTSFTNLLSRPLQFKTAKFATVMVILILCGSATVFGSSYLLKTYPVTFKIQKAEETEVDPNTIRNFFNFDNAVETMTFGESTLELKETGEVLEIYDDNGDIIEYRHLADYVTSSDPVKSGDDAFDKINLPNLTPTYLLENYKLGTGGYKYGKWSFSNDPTSKISFIYGKDNIEIYCEYIQSQLPVDNSISIIESFTKESTKYSSDTFVTESGIICNLLYENDNAKMVQINIESETYGYGIYHFSFTSNLDINEIESILNSIPLSASELSTKN